MVHIALLGGIAHAVVLPAAPRKSAALPWMNAPTDPFFATTVGDCGFDPLGLARSPAILDYYREAELKHSRLAMLAAVGWPASELWDRWLSTLIGAEPKLTAAGDAPSLLNGGLENVNPSFWGAALGVGVAVEAWGLSRRLADEPARPGDLGFDPLGMFPTDPSRRRSMELAELKHGRVAMVAVVGYAAEEFFLKTPVAAHSAGFFEPLWAHLI